MQEALCNGLGSSRSSNLRNLRNLRNQHLHRRRLKPRLQRSRPDLQKCLRLKG